jgi:hypothetical protein
VPVCLLVQRVDPHSAADKVCLVRDAVRIGKVDHVIRIVLLVTDVTHRKECIDPIDTG